MDTTGVVIEFVGGPHDGRELPVPTDPGDFRPGHKLLFAGPAHFTPVTYRLDAESGAPRRTATYAEVDE